MIHFSLTVQTVLPSLPANPGLRHYDRRLDALGLVWRTGNYAAVKATCMKQQEVIPDAQTCGDKITRE